MQRLGCGTMDYFAVRVEARAVAGTGKPLDILFHGTAQMCAGQAEGRESLFGVDQNGGRIGKRRT